MTSLETSILVVGLAEDLARSRIFFGNATDDLVDWALWAHGVPNLANYPFPITEPFLPATIGEARFMPGLIQSQHYIAKVGERARCTLARFSLNPPVAEP